MSSVWRWPDPFSIKPGENRFRMNPEPWSYLICGFAPKIFITNPSVPSEQSIEPRLHLVEALPQAIDWNEQAAGKLVRFAFDFIFPAVVLVDPVEVMRGILDIRLLENLPMEKQVAHFVGKGKSQAAQLPVRCRVYKIVGLTVHVDSGEVGENRRIGSKTTEHSVVWNDVELQFQFDKGNQVKGQSVCSEGGESFAQFLHLRPNLGSAGHRRVGSGLVQFLDAFDEPRDVVGHIFLTTNGAEEGWKFRLDFLALKVCRELAAGDRRQVIEFHPAIGIEAENRPDLVE